MAAAENIQVRPEAVLVSFPGRPALRLPSLWLRDNCPCGECRVAQTGEKKFILSEVPADLSASAATMQGKRLQIAWPDGHVSSFDLEQIRAARRPRQPPWQPWAEGFLPSRFGWAAFLGDDAVARDALHQFLAAGAIVLTEAPREPGSLESLCARLGPIREVLFDRIHDVRVDPGGYNVAHTPLALPPHNDFASYSWPPSVQALHMLENRVPGGASIIVDGWALLRQLRADHPDYFDSLCHVEVPFREYDEHNETYAVAPLVRCDSAGHVAALRFSNQLMQMMDPAVAGVDGFYRAYHELCRRVTDTPYRSVFRLEGGQVLLTAGHRVLHAREAFEPLGPRHLQDAYFELDNVANALVVLRRSEAAQ